MNDRDTSEIQNRLLLPHLSTRVLRALVPASLAGGIMALYPAISESAVERLGEGFQPHLVAVYVTILVGLFITDAWIRDRRLARVRTIAARAEMRAEGQRHRADELRLLLDLSAEMSSEGRIEDSLHRVLNRLRQDIPFGIGYVFLRGEGSGLLSRRGICPLTASPSPHASELAELAIAAAESKDVPAGPCRHPSHPREVACPIRTDDGEVVGAIVLEGARSLAELRDARLLALADRLALSLKGLQLRAQLEDKERALRNAYRELRFWGRILARSSALEEATMVGDAVSQTLTEPVENSQRELRRLERTLAPAERAPAIKESLARVRKNLDAIATCRDELRALGKREGRPSDVRINDALVAALDLELPDLKRSGIEVRLTLDSDLPDVRIDEGLLVHTLTRLLRRARAALRRAPAPRRLTLESRPYGDGAKIVIHDNSAGLSSEGVEHFVRRSSADAEQRISPLRRALRSTERNLFRADLAAHGVSIRTEEELGSGRTLTLCLRGMPAEGLV